VDITRYISLIYHFHTDGINKKNNINWLAKYYLIYRKRLIPNQMLKMLIAYGEIRTNRIEGDLMDITKNSNAIKNDAYIIQINDDKRHLRFKT
jgi:hypothetical protein